MAPSSRNRIEVGRLHFTFPHAWQVAEYDRWSFFLNQFSKLGSARSTCPRCADERDTGTKGVDLIAMDDSAAVWCIEVKDYRVHRRTKAMGLADEVALKVRDTLASLLAAKTNANDAAERDFAAHAVDGNQLRVVLHLEQPRDLTKPFPRAINPANVLQRLKQLVKAIDPHPLVLESGEMRTAAWIVRKN